MARLSVFEKRTKCTQRAAGLRKHFAGGDTLWGSVTAGDMLAPLDAYVAALDEAKRAETARRVAVEKARSLESAAIDACEHVDSFVRNEYGRTSQIAQVDFGIAVHKSPGPKTNAAKVEMVKKAAATRVARGTKGKRQKKAIKG